MKDAGFDLVTTANNHILDKGEEGAKRTLDVLDEVGLDHVGSYRAQGERERVKLIEVGGVRIAVLAYTYGCNYHSTKELVEGELSYVTSVLYGGEYSDTMRAGVEADFERAKALEPDLIMVLPHMGTQFSNEPDGEQETWFELFRSLGADIILGDHPHAVQPAALETYGDRQVFTAWCPGNFANIYREQQGDTSMLVDVYIDPETKELVGGSVVPLYTQSTVDGNYRAIPVYDIVNDPELRSTLSTDDYLRAAQANATVTRVVFGHEMDISSVTERYYFDASGFLRTPADKIEPDGTERTGTLYRALEGAKSVCFIGDSVTEGTKNGGCPWYEPIVRGLDISVTGFAKGGATVSYFLDRADSVPVSDLYVIALGTNDVRYRDGETCAMTAQEYISELEKLRGDVAGKNPEAKFVFLAPWYSTDGDPYTPLGFEAKTELTEEYTKSLKSWCAGTGDGFVDPNPYIIEAMEHVPQSDYLLDHIHPNAGRGVELYSHAALRG